MDEHGVLGQFENPIKDTHSATEEIFRCLLATGTQMMLPRAIARMLHRSALLLQLRLPESVDQMLVMITKTSWRPSDIHQLDSMYSTWDLDGRVTAAGGKRKMEAMLKEWERLEIADNSIETDEE